MLDARLVEHRLGVFRQINQQPTAQRLHNHYSHTALGCHLHTLYTRLIIAVIVIQLDLAEIPVGSIQNFFKQFQIIMEGKPDIAYFPASFGALHAVDCIVAYCLFPAAAIHRVQEVVVNIIETQTVKLFIKEAIEIFGRFVKPCG